MYELYIDDPQAIKCKAEISGADASTKKVRLMVETQTHCLYFNGKVSDDGEIDVPITPLKNILKESTKGKLMLEMIVDDTLFIPWETEFEAKLKKKIEIKEVKSITSGKNVKMLVSPTQPVKETKRVEKSNNQYIIDHVKGISKILKSNKISYLNLSENKIKVSSIINEYVIKNKISVDNLKKIQTVLINHITEL